MKLIRRSLAALAIVIIALVVLVVALPGEKIAKLAADQVKAQTGRDLEFDGKVSISWYPVLGVKTETVRFGNAPWSTKGPMFQADSAVIGVDVMAALGGEIRVKTVELVAPDVLLEVASDGRSNWVLGGSDAAETSTTPTTPTSASSFDSVTIERLMLSEARLRYFEADRLVQEVAGLSLDLSWPSPNAPAELTLKAAPFGSDISAQATLSKPLALLQSGPTPLSMTLAAAGGSARFEGQIARAPEAQGKLAITAPDGAAFLAAFGMGGVDGALAASGDVTFTKEQQFSLRAGRVEALGNALTLQADVDLNGPRPKVAAQIATNHLHIPAATEPASTGSGAQPAETGGWSKEPIDASALGLLDGTITFAAETMDIAGVSVGKTRATVAIDNARAVTTLSEMAVFDGIVQGSFVANNRNGLSVRGNLTAAQIGLKPLLTSLADIDRFTGAADLQSRFLSSGNSLHALMNAMSGEGALSVGRGTIEGMDLDRLLRGEGTGGTTVFDTMAASWTIKDGVLTNKDLLMNLPRLAATGEGTVGLGQQTIDYLFTPQVRGSDGPALMVPVNIRGSWQDPSIQPDLEAAIKSGFQSDLKELEGEAKQAVEQKLKLQRQEGQSTEDAIKDKLEDEAKRSLKKLFGRD